MLGALVDVPDLGIVEARVISQIERIGGYTLYRVQFNPNDKEINPSTITCHENEIEVVDDSKLTPLGDAEFELGDHVKIKHPINVEGIVTGINHSNSGCTEYEVDYLTDRGIVSHTLPGPVLQKTGRAAMAGTQTGSMNRSVERRM